MERAGTPPDRPSTAYRAREAVAAIRTWTNLTPTVGLILGSGLGALAESIAQPVVVPYSVIPGFPVPTAPGHAGHLVLGTLQGVPVAAMRGRIHLYEGHTAEEVAFPVRVLRRLGAGTLVVTNAAGGLNPAYQAGDLMLLMDHLNVPGLAGLSPLVGVDEPALGPRFVDLVSAYDPALRDVAHEVSAAHGFTLREGVYAMVVGPTYETPAEVRFLRAMGADAVGMSTLPEVIVARQEGMRVLGVSIITNVAQEGSKAAATVTHETVLAAAERARPRLSALVAGVVERLA